MVLWSFGLFQGSLGLFFLGITSPLFAQRWAPNLSTTATWHDNATNADAALDRIGALLTRADVAVSQRFGLSGSDALHLGGRITADWWPRFHGLSQAAAGAQLEWRRKFGLGPLAPVFATELSAGATGARESFRQGTSAGLAFSLRKRFDHAWHATLATELARFDARSVVFDRSGSETAVEVERTLTARSHLALRVSYRDGDVLSYGTPPRPDLVLLAPARISVTTFRVPMTAYSISAHTVGARAAFLHAIGSNSAATFAFEWRETNRTPLRYVNQLVSLSLVRQF